jgi:hypothetical protein
MSLTNSIGKSAVVLDWAKDHKIPIKNFKLKRQSRKKTLEDFSGIPNLKPRGVLFLDEYSIGSKSLEKAVHAIFTDKVKEINRKHRISVGKATKKEWLIWAKEKKLSKVSVRIVTVFGMKYARLAANLSDAFKNVS